MYVDVKKLFSIAKKPSRKIIGLMSGTSLDGLDVALCKIYGNGLQTKIKLLRFETVAYKADFKKEIKTIFSKKNIDLEKLCLLNAWIAMHHVKIVNTCLKKWGIKNDEIDLIASHGQTIYHAPKNVHQQNKFGNATLQIGDGDHLAQKTGILTISDFRQKHIAAGGEGAPLAVYGDYLIFSKHGEDRILLNIGGISNFTFLPKSLSSSLIFSTDTGPGNTLMDAYIQQHFSKKYYDKNAAIALKGKINIKLLNALCNNDFFKQPFPNTTGPELFNLGYLNNAKEKSATTQLSIEDTMATLNKFSAVTIANAMKRFSNKIIKVFISGGGMHNPLLIQHLKDLLPNFLFYSTADLGINPDAKEALLFAVLANECICGNGDYLQKNTKGMPAISMGKISFPH